MKRTPQFRPERMLRDKKRRVMQLKKAGVADREKFVRGCLAIVGFLLVLLALAFLYQIFYR